MNKQSDYQLFFTYGQKVKLLNQGKSYTCVMVLSASNNFFLEFVSLKEKLNIVKQVFVPHIKNIREKFKSKKIKIRMQNPRESFYLVNNNITFLQTIAQNFKHFIKYIKKFKYNVFSWNNLMHYTLFKLKIHKQLGKDFKQKDIKMILERIKIFNKKQHKKQDQKKFQNQCQKLPKQKTKFSLEFNVKRQESLKEKNSSSTLFILDIKQKLERLLHSQQNSLLPEEIQQIFKTIVQRNELYALYECCLQNNTPKKNGNMEQELITERMIKNSSLNSIPNLPEKNKNLTFEKFLDFLIDIQKEDLDANDLEKITQFFQQIRIKNIFDQSKNQKEIKSITFEEFCMYIFSKRNLIIDPKKSHIYQDENYPLSYYFINSSHNTYLVGHQLYGKSGLEGYQRAIEQGFRCLEIDIWNGNNGQPTVTHGKTLTKNQSLDSIVELLARISFKHNNYPLILSLEMHCNLVQRKIVAQIFMKYFQDRLLLLDYKKIKKNYTLKNLKGKVLLKTDSAYFEDLQLEFTNLNEKNKQFLNDSLSRITSIFKESFSVKDFINGGPEMKNFITYFGVASFSNSKMKKILKEGYRLKMIKFARNHLIRIYPDATHINSSNYNPIQFWISGVQMVCLNIQYADDHLLINKVKFRKNGGRRSGYLLKPQFMIQKSQTLDVRLREYHIDIISAQIIGNELVQQNDVLEISFKGHSSDEMFNKQKYYYDFDCNFIHPIINRKQNQSIVFKVSHASFGYFLFKIKNQKGVIKHQSCIGASMIRPGFRVLQFYNKELFHNDYSFLLLKFYKKQLIVLSFDQIDFIFCFLSFELFCQFFKICKISSFAKNIFFLIFQFLKVFY